MAIQLFNTLTKKIEDLIPINNSHINLFVCGQTVYDDMHLGHAKTYANFAMIVRWLRLSGYDVRYIQNITDVDDKIINRARELGISEKELVNKYETRFFEDVEKLGIKNDVDAYLRSHDYIDAIKDQIQTLLNKNFAYYLDGDIYFDVDKFEDYTLLSGMKLNDLGVHRIEPKAGKKNTYDFALWKSAKENEPKWNIELNINGKWLMLSGRPGWHIEDTAMTFKEFGPQYDIHGGASELIFPHHTNEIAQAEAASGLKPFVKYWMHSGVLFINNEKMSKSLKNFIRVREVLEKYDYEALRLLISSTHYRKAIDYNEGLIEESKQKLNYMYSVLNLFYNLKNTSSIQNNEINKHIENFKLEFVNAMNNDFNSPLALSSLMTLINYLKEYCKMYGEIGDKAKENAINEILKLSNVLGILENNKYKKNITDETLDLIKKREEARKSKDFIKADELRKIINEKNIEIEDTEKGTIWYFKFI
ncbi:MAG: cysteine--tRNA ligase [Candidatus Micrarchaeaceae archaeon]